VDKTLKETNGTSKVRIRYLVMVLVVAAAGGLYWKSRSANAEKPVQNPPPIAQVGASRPLERNVDTTVGVLGQFSAVDQVDLRAQVGGTLTGIFFTDGAIVHKGDRLFAIDPEPYQIRLDQARAQLATSRARFDLATQELHRAQDLQRNEAGTVQDVQQRSAEQRSAQAAVESAAAQIRDAQFDLSHCVVYAPFTGRIGSHQVSIGNLVAGSRAASSPTTLLATLVSLDPIYLNFDMSEADFRDLQLYRSQNGDASSNQIQFAPGNANQYSGRGALDFLDNTIDHSSGTIHARATVKNRDLLLTPGEFSRIRVVVSPPKPALLVPDSSVLPDQSQHVVLTVSDAGIVVPKHVETGDLRGGLRVIKSGISASDNVIVEGIAFAAPGAKVKQHPSTINYSAAQD